MLAVDDAKEELNELQIVSIPSTKNLMMHRTRAAYRVKEGAKKVEAAAIVLGKAEVHFDQIRARASAQICRDIVEAATLYEQAVDDADITLPEPPTTSAPTTATTTTITRSTSSRDRCCAMLAQLGNVGPLAKGDKVQVVINRRFVNAIVIGPSASSSSSSADSHSSTNNTDAEDQKEWSLRVFTEVRNHWEEYQAGYLREASFSRSDIYGGKPTLGASSSSSGGGGGGSSTGHRVRHNLPASCF